MAITEEDKLSRYKMVRSDQEEWTILCGIIQYGVPFLSRVQSLGLCETSFTNNRASLVFGTLVDHTGAGKPLVEESIIASLDDALESKKKRFEARKEKGESDVFTYGATTGESLATILFWEAQYKAQEESSVLFASRVVSRARFRQVTGEIRGLLSTASTWDGEPQSFVEEAQRRILSIPAHTSSQNDVKRVSDYINPILDRMWNEYQSGGDMGGLKTGYPTLDRLTNGMRKSDLVIVAAQSGVGKSAFAVNVAVRLAKQGKKVLIFSLEMDIDELVERMIWIETRIWSDLYWERKMTEEDWEKITKASVSLCAQNITIVDNFSMTMTQIASIARHQMFSEGIDFVIVDYAQIIRTREDAKSNATNENRESQVREVADALKRMVGDIGCPVMALAQLNDDNKVRESRALKFNASHLWILSVSGTQEGLGEAGAEGKVKRYELLLEKGRRSATGRVIPMLFFGAQTRLEEEAVEVMGEESGW